MSTTPREMNAHFDGICAVCRRSFRAETRISYTPPHDGERARTVHLECVGREQQPLNDYQRSQIFEQSSPFPSRGRADQAQRRVIDRALRQACPACDNSGYHCDVCGNPGLENAPCNQPKSGTAPDRAGRKVESAPEASASRQSTEPVTSGFPRRPARARHIGATGNRFAVNGAPELETRVSNSAVGHPDLPRGIDGRVKGWAWLDPAVCPRCADRAGPSHTGSPMCRSGSIASGGLRSHCSCEGCF